MNTVDAVTDLGGKVANFLDSGGKATKETIKSAFGLVLRDQRVKAIFVNIFGGITRCDMIAEGVMLAYQDLGIKLPVVIRLKGTNEAEGQKKVMSDFTFPLPAGSNALHMLTSSRSRRVGFACLHTTTSKKRRKK